MLLRASYQVMPPVLVLEPDLGIQRMLKALLERDGFTPTFTRDGKGAVRAMAREQFAAFIIDISVWPSTLERNSRRGVGFLHWLQRNDPAALQRLVALSALSDREVPRDLPAVRSFLHKPFSIDDLRAALADCVAAAA